MNGLEIKKAWLNEMQDLPTEADPQEMNHMTDALAYMLMEPPKLSVKTQLLSTIAADPFLQVMPVKKVRSSQTQTTSMAEPITTSEILSKAKTIEDLLTIRMQQILAMTQAGQITEMLFYGKSQLNLQSRAINLDLEAIDPSR